MQDSTRQLSMRALRKTLVSKVLQGISGSINRGEVVAVIGSSVVVRVRLRCFNRLEKIDRGVWK